LPLALLIQKELGHGSLARKKGVNAYILTINNREGLLLIVSLINGKMRTPKIKALWRLIDWLNLKDQNINLEKKALDTGSLATNPWLSGFIEAANSSFSVLLNKSSIRVRFSLKQKSATPLDYNYEGVISTIAEFLNVNVVSHSVKKAPFSLEFEIRTTSIKSNDILINYLNTFPLFSSKYLNYKDWVIAFEMYKGMSGDSEDRSEHIKQMLPVFARMGDKRTMFNWDHLRYFYTI
jgi:hypothetical protein